MTFDTVRYYAFLLEAMSRFGREGAHLRTPLLPPFRRRKPSLPLPVARRMRRNGVGPSDGSVLEFGVYQGRSIRALARLFPGARLFGFDTFTGFPEDGRTDWRGLDFATAVPAVPARVELVIGPFQDTLPAFVGRSDVPAPARLIHVDCDLYSSTAAAFRALGPTFIVPGTVVIFDELLNYGEAIENELLAFYEMLGRLGYGFEWFVTIGTTYPLERLARGDIPRRWEEFRSLGCYQNAAVVITGNPIDDGRLAPFLAQAGELAAVRPVRPASAPP